MNKNDKNNLLVLGNKCEIYLFTKKKKKKKKKKKDNTTGNLSYHRKFSNRKKKKKKKKGNTCLKSICFSFQKNTFCA